MDKAELTKKLVEVFSEFLGFDDFGGVIREQKDFKEENWEIARQAIENIDEHVGEYCFGFLILDKNHERGAMPYARPCSRHLHRYIKTTAVRHFDNYLFMRGVAWRSTCVQMIGLDIHTQTIYDWRETDTKRGAANALCFLVITFVPISIFDISGLNKNFDHDQL